MRSNSMVKVYPHEVARYYKKHRADLNYNEAFVRALIENSPFKVVRFQPVTNTALNRINRLWLYPLVALVYLPPKYIIQGEWGLDYADKSRVTRVVDWFCGAH